MLCMTVPTARAPMAPGQWCFRRSAGSGLRRRWPSLRRVRGVLALLMVLATLGGCQLVGAGPEAPAPPAPPRISEGFATPEERAEGERLLAEAEAAWAAGDARRAVEAAGTVVEGYARVEGSARALWILAAASAALQDWEVAASAAQRYAPLVPAGGEEAADAHLLRSQALESLGRPEEAALALLEIARGTPDPARDRGRERMAGLSRVLGVEALERVAMAPGVAGSPVVSPLLAELATALHFRGDADGARDMARRILEVDPGADDRRVALAIIEGRAGDELGVAPLVAAILPLEGSPSVRPFAEAVEEGIRLAMEGVASSRRPVLYRTEDDAGNTARTTGALAGLEGEGVLGVLGPLTDDALATAARARTRSTVLVSPTAQNVPEGAANVYTLAATDPASGETLARWALANGIRRAAVLYPRNADGVLEAGAFSRAFQAGGGSVVFDQAFEPATAFFQEPLRRVAAANPDALVLPLSPREVAVVAPQVTFYGLDSLGIRVLGTGGWTTEETLRNVDVRHTDGVVAVTSQPPGIVAERYAAFVEEYESFYQKSLRTPVAALGYDAALLLLRALETGARTPDELSRALEGVRDLPGATGDLSVVDGRITRRHRPVRLEGRQLVELPVP